MSSKTEIVKFKQRVKKLVAANRLVEVFEVIYRFADLNSQVENKIVRLEYMYNRSQRELREGVRDIAEINRERNQISGNLLELIDELNESDFIDILENSEVVKRLQLDLEVKEQEIRDKEQELENLSILLADKEEEYLKLLKELEECRKNKSSIEILTISTSEIEDLIKRGESQTLEFKASISYGLEVVLRTICAFMNQEGGVILFGIKDDKTIIGIESDRKNIDRFQRDISGAARFRLGLHSASLINFDLVEYQEKLILRIDISKSKTPIFYKDQKLSVIGSGEIFITRIGPANTQIKGLSATVNYISERFPSN